MPTRILKAETSNKISIDYGDWSAVIDALAKHFCDRITHFEIWNEPDIPQFWYPEKSNGAEYARLVKLTAQIIKSHAPDAKIGISVSTPYCFDFIEDTLSSLPDESAVESRVENGYTYITLPAIVRYNAFLLKK